MRPRDFWALYPDEFWWLADARKPPKTYAGGLSEADVADLYEDLKRQGAFQNG